LTVVDIMTPPRVVLEATEPSPAALLRLREAHVDGAPVVNADGAFLGVVAADVLEREHRCDTVGGLADPEAITLPSEAGLDAAVDALPASSGGWVPVLDDRMHVLGIISIPELIQACRQTMRTSWSEIVNAASNTELIEGFIARGAPADGRSVTDLELPPGTIVLPATNKSGALRFPDATDHLTADERLTVLVSPRHETAVREALGLRDDEEPSHPRGNRSAAIAHRG
jgi:hypothetical protein